MKKWKSILVSPDTTILETIQVIDRSAMQIALVVGEHNRLLGTVTDGDIRRGILKNISLNGPIHQVMNCDPFVASSIESPRDIQSRMKSRGLKHIPVVDDRYSVVDLYMHDQFVSAETKENWVILMAGGLGTRLKPLTDHSPKPLLRVGNKPILETIVTKFAEYNFTNFFISVNYKADQIKTYFADGSKWGIHVRYIDETERLGTAGALSLLPEKPQHPIIVMNGDLLTKVNFDQLLEFHNASGLPATMCVREIQQQIPYGVVKTEEHRLLGIEEKPMHSYFVNAGIYVLSPEILLLIPHNTFYDMPTLFDRLITNGIGASVFPIREYWLDIGRMSDFEKANMEFTGEFL